MDKQKNKIVGSSKKTTKYRGGDASSRGANRRDGGSLHPEFQGDLYRPKLTQPNPQGYFTQPPPNFYSPTYNTQFFPHGSVPTQPQPNPQGYFTQPPPTYDFSGEAMESFEVFEEEEDDDDDDDDPVPETQFEDDEEEEQIGEDVEVREDPKGKKKGKFSGRAERIDWGQDEEVALAKAYIHVSVDRVKGNEQSSGTLWNAVLKHYNELVGGSNRTIHQVRSKWGKMLTQLNAFNGFTFKWSGSRKSKEGVQGR